LIVYLDTHVAVWLGAGETQLLSRAAGKLIETGDLLISPVVFLEFQYLNEKGAVRESADRLFSYLNATFGIGMCDYPFPAVCTEAARMTWTRDPFDRVIAGHASARNAALITSDRVIREHYNRSVW